MTNNEIAFTALCNEYCTALADPFAFKATDFVDTMLRLLPRIYICARDCAVNEKLTEGNGWIDAAMSEAEYDSARRAVSALLGEHDVYLEVFEEDMKYSETPVSSSISENLADIYQALYDFLNTVRYGTDETASAAIEAVTESFREYWGTVLCNVLRALNYLWAQGLISDDEQASSGNQELD